MGRLTTILAFVAVVSAVVTPVSAAYDPEAFRWGSVHIGSCLETCCCKVCSSPTAQAFPYGLIDTTIEENPTQPKVIGASCRVPTWRDRGLVNDTVNNFVMGPNKLFWTDFSVFADSEAHVAPTTCDCCQLAVDTNCVEEAPIAKKPAYFKVLLGGVVLEGQPAEISFEGGYGLSSLDLAELRNDTFCGYNPPAYTMRTPIGRLVNNADSDHALWHIDRMPVHGCYRVCYYQQNLTTPGWYYIGDIVVHQQPQAALTYIVNPHDVLLTGNQVTLTFTGRNLLNVFDDLAELRTTGTCGTAGYTVRTGQAGYPGLQVLPGADWCHPPVVPGITAERPLRRIAVQYSDCPNVNRIFVGRLTWSPVLPAAATYTVCYRQNGTWYQLANTLPVPAQQTVVNALMALYGATGGNSWRFTTNWGSATPCDYHGVRCDALGNVVAIYLGRNNLKGTLPVAFFRAPYFNTLTDLKLDMNGLTGPVPVEIGVFRKLRVLDLSYNSLTGTLPVTLLQTSLQTLYVPGNAFDGLVPHDLAQLSQQWTAENSLTNEPAANVTAYCPTPVEECSDRGSTTPGVTQCGHSGITEPECTIRGCCFNSQAPLTFGGTACFTRRPVTYETHPPCQIGVPTCTPIAPAQN